MHDQSTCTNNLFTQVAIISDTNELMSKIIVLKEVFPNANVLRLLSDQPRMLLIPTTDLKADAEKVGAVLPVLKWRLANDRACVSCLALCFETSEKSS